MTSRVARNTLFNIAGEGAPLLAALVAIPLLLKGIGVDRFGLLGIAWMVIGYASLLDFGLGRALTKIVSEKVSTGRASDVPGIVWTSIVIMFGLGVLGACLIAVSAPVFVEKLRMPDGLRPEAVTAFRVLALSLPVVIIGVGLRGTLEALHRFDLSNAVRIPAGVFAVAGPLFVLPFTPSLIAVVAVLAVGRLASCIAYLTLCVRALPSLRTRVGVQLEPVRKLLSFGGWMTVSNVVSPLMTVFDRFIIGALISTEAVAYYTTPYDMVSKMVMVSAALTGVLFPTFAGIITQDRERVMRLFGRSVTYVFLVLFPITLVVVALAHEGLTLWGVGPEMARESAPVLQILAVGVLINALALVPFTLIQAAGRPDITAKLHLFELPLYLVAIVVFTRRYGIIGSAIVSAARMTFDAACLFLISRRLVRFRVNAGLVAAVVAFSVVALATFALLSSAPFARSVSLVVALMFFFGLALTRLITPEDRALMSRWKGGILAWIVS